MIFYTDQPVHRFIWLLMALLACIVTVVHTRDMEDRDAQRYCQQVLERKIPDYRQSYVRDCLKEPASKGR